MLEMIVDAGTNIDDACLWAARIAHLPLAKSTNSGSYYAFDIRCRDGAMGASLTAGPWHDAECAEEFRRGQRFRDYCKEMRCEYSFMAQCVGGDPGVEFEFNGITVACNAWHGDRSVLRIAGDLFDLYMRKCDARLEGIRG